MKKLFAIISAFMLTVASYAQDGKFSIQPMVGLSATSSFVFSYEGMANLQAQIGYGFTVGADFGYHPSQKFYPSVGLHLVQSRLNFEAGVVDCNITATNLAIPVMANFKVSDLRLGVGIQPTFNLSNSFENLTLRDDAVKSTVIAIPVVVGYEFKNGITLEYRAAFDVTKSVDHDASGIKNVIFEDNKLSSSNLTSMITIGYKFKM